MLHARRYWEAVGQTGEVSEQYLQQCDARRATHHPSFGSAWRRSVCRPRATFCEFAFVTSSSWSALAPRASRALCGVATYRVASRQIARVAKHEPPVFTTCLDRVASRQLGNPRPKTEWHSARSAPAQAVLTEAFALFEEVLVLLHAHSTLGLRDGHVRRLGKVASTLEHAHAACAGDGNDDGIHLLCAPFVASSQRPRGGVQDSQEMGRLRRAVRRLTSGRSHTLPQVRAAVAPTILATSCRCTGGRRRLCYLSAGRGLTPLRGSRALLRSC